MNSQSSGSAAPPVGTTSGSSATYVSAVNSGLMFSKGLTGAIMPPSSSSVIQSPHMNSQSVVAVSAAAGATVTLARPPMQTCATLNGNIDVTPAVIANTTGQTIGTPNPLVSSSQPSSSVSVSAGSHIIKAEPPTTIIQSPPQQAISPGAVNAPRAPVTVAAGPAGIQTLTPQMLPPRLPQTSPGQPSIHNIQLPPGEWIIHILLPHDIKMNIYYIIECSSSLIKVVAPLGFRE